MSKDRPESGRGFQFTVLCDAGALPDGALERAKAEMEKGLKSYLADVEAGKFIDPQNFITVEQLLDARFDPKILPFITRRKRR